MEEVYEIGYLLIPSIAEEKVGAEVTNLKDMLAKFKASVISDEYPKMTKLAYEISKTIESKRTKFSYGYFGWIKFDSDKETVKEVEKSLKENNNIIRFLLIKTVRESTISQKRSYNRSNRKKKVEEKSQPINEETIDKEIDALVVE
ncbi:MAG: 30S ribosomal protein S6 [Patescibacteria group bacterium]|nr:30S ribosomal protein S6 [Patescibacteria group bacterium]